MPEEVEACATITRSKQRKKKKGLLLYSILKELNNSKMRRSNVVQRFIPDHVNTARALDFQTTDAHKIPCTSMCILPNVKEEAKALARDDADVDEDSEDQVSFNFQIAFLVNRYCL
jgi:hypothetical protein